MQMVGMDVHISKRALEKVSAEEVFNANVVNTLSNLGILVFSKTEDESGVHYRWKLEERLLHKKEEKDEHD